MELAAPKSNSQAASELISNMQHSTYDLRQNQSMSSMNLTSQKKQNEQRKSSFTRTSAKQLSVQSLSGYRNNFIVARQQKSTLTELTNVSPIKVEV